VVPHAKVRKIEKNFLDIPASMTEVINLAVKQYHSTQEVFFRYMVFWYQDSEFYVQFKNINLPSE
jgi:hypothetical protein